jgi:hypothetical protein
VSICVFRAIEHGQRAKRAKASSSEEKQEQEQHSNSKPLRGNTQRAHLFEVVGVDLAEEGVEVGDVQHVARVLFAQLWERGRCAREEVCERCLLVGEENRGAQQNSNTRAPGRACSARPRAPLVSVFKDELNRGGDSSPRWPRRA